MCFIAREDIVFRSNFCKYIKECDHQRVKVEDTQALKPGIPVTWLVKLTANRQTGYHSKMEDWQENDK